MRAGPTLCVRRAFCLVILAVLMVSVLASQGLDDFYGPLPRLQSAETIVAIVGNEADVAPAFVARSC
jgi:hypothetical protein